MSKDGWIKDSITLRGEEVPLRVGFLPQANLRFFPDNPRIYSALSAWDKEPSQEDIQEMLLRRENVRQLIQSIKANGGLTDPVFVLDGTLVVLEGNSRLAAYRALAAKDAIKWAMIKCKVMPADTDEDKIFSLLGEYHIIGKQDWAPYEQAGYLHRRYTNYGTPQAKMARDLGLTPATVKHLIAVYGFMIEHEDANVNRWSYYDELLKSRKVKKAREKFPDFDKKAVAVIKSGEITRAMEFRDGLKKLGAGGDRIVSKFVSGKRSFKECVELAKSGGADEHCYQTIKKFRTWLADAKVKHDILDLPENIRKKVLFEVRKVKVGIKNLERRLDK